MALIPVFPGRPPVVRLPNGAIVYLSVMDAAYLAQRTAWRQKLKLLHPDSGDKRRSAKPVQKALTAYRVWLHAQETAYAALGQEPPRGTEAQQPKPRRRRWHGVFRCPTRKTRVKVSGRWQKKGCARCLELEMEVERLRARLAMQAQTG